MKLWKRNKHSTGTQPEEPETELLYEKIPDAKKALEKAESRKLAYAREQVSFLINNACRRGETIVGVDKKYVNGEMEEILKEKGYTVTDGKYNTVIRWKNEPAEEQKLRSADELLTKSRRSRTDAWKSLTGSLEAAASGGVTELFVHTIPDEEIRELNKLGYDVEIVNRIMDNDDYEVRIYWGADASGRYENPVADFYRLAEEKRLEIYEYTDEEEKRQFLDKWEQTHGDMPCPPEIKLYIGIPGGTGEFYEWYEEFIYQPTVSDVKRLVDKVISQEEQHHSS